MISARLDICRTRSHARRCVPRRVTIPTRARRVPRFAPSRSVASRAAIAHIARDRYL